MKLEAVMEHPATSREVRLISLDFDGTILVYDDPEGVFHPEVITFLNSLEELGVRWCANSGRDRADQLAVIERSRERGLTFMPDALICSESMVYVKAGSDYTSLEPWNSSAHACLRACHREVQARLSDHLDYIQKVYQPISTLIGEHFTAFFVRDHDQLPQRLLKDIGRFTAGVADMMLTRNGGWVSLMHTSLGKGNALKEYARHIDLKPDHILAVGDQYNDLPMLRTDVAKHLGCPGNAIPEVIQTVSMAGGHVARAHGPLGTIEVMRARLFS